MRGMEGKLITVWSPGLHGVGVSTVTDALGFALQYNTNRKVLIINNCGCLSYLERFMENDIKIKYTLDNLKVFNGNISTEHIMTYATSIKENLYMIAGSRFEKAITKEDKDFDQRLLGKCLELFDIVVTDINTGIREDNILYLDKADALLPVVTANEIMLDDLLESSKAEELKQYIYNDKAVLVFNKLYEGWDIERELKQINKKYQFEASFGLHFSGNVFEACCRKRQFYSFVMKELEAGDTSFCEQMTDLCDFLIEKLYLASNHEFVKKKRNLLSLFTL